MDLKKLLEKRNTIYGVCAIWIVLFHTFRRISMPYIPVVTNIIGIGNMGVDIFLFYSGLCLSLSVKRHNYPATGWGEYYKRRLMRIFVPYLLICIPYYLWAAIFEASGSGLRRILVFVANLSSASFWLKGTQTTWYVYGIMAFYILFPGIFTLLSRVGKTRKYLLLLGAIVFAVITAYTPILKNSTIVWSRLPIFIIGVMIGMESHGRLERSPSKTEIIAAGAILLLLSALTSISEISDSFTIRQIYRLLLYIPMTLSVMVLLSISKRKSKLFAWLGGLSLEIYLVHITLLHPLKLYGIIDAVGNWLYLLLPVVSTIIAFAFSKIGNIVIKNIEKT